MVIDNSIESSSTDTTISKHFLINWFVFFLGFPFLDILGNSATFYIFILILLHSGSRLNSKYKGRTLFISFITVGVLSSILAPEMNRHPGLLSITKLLIQFAYWITLAGFLVQNYRRINLLSVSKFFFVSIIISSFFFYFFPLEFDSFILSIKLGQDRNAFVFNLLCSIPFSFYYIKNKWGRKGTLTFTFLFLAIMFGTNGRAGSILLILELLLIYSILIPSLQSWFKKIIILLLVCFVFLESGFFNSEVIAFGALITKVNPRLGGLILDEGDGSLEKDKSWGQRKLMVEKGKEIFKEYPILGIGPNNFTFYDAKLKAHSSSEFFYLVQSRQWYNSRSAHNSYIQVLSEYGLLGLVIFLLIIFKPLGHFLKIYLRNQLTFEHVPLISLLILSIYFYAISNFTGAMPWLIIGWSWGVLNWKNNT